jgi:hypothetical protein
VASLDKSVGDLPVGDVLIDGAIAHHCWLPIEKKLIESQNWVRQGVSSMQFVQSHHRIRANSSEPTAPVSNIIAVPER